MKTINTINSILYIALTVLYFYQFIYIVIALIGDKKKKLDTYEAKKASQICLYYSGAE